VSESAMVGKAEDRSVESTEYVQVGRFGGQGHGGRGQCCFPIEASAP
jgi:hypothetical protein